MFPKSPTRHAPITWLRKLTLGDIRARLPDLADPRSFARTHPTEFFRSVYLSLFLFPLPRSIAYLSAFRPSSLCLINSLAISFLLSVSLFLLHPSNSDVPFFPILFFLHFFSPSSLLYYPFHPHSIPAKHKTVFHHTNGAQITRHTYEFPFYILLIDCSVYSTVSQSWLMVIVMERHLVLIPMAVLMVTTVAQ